MASPVELHSKRNTTLAILKAVGDSMSLPQPLEEYVAGLSEIALDEIIETAAKAMSNNMPELVYSFGYDVYNEAAKLRHVGVMVHNNDGCGAIIQIIQDRQNTALYKTNIVQMLPFTKESNRDLVNEWVADFNSEHAKWQAMGSVATREDLALRATSKLGKTGSYVYGHTDTRFLKFVKEKCLTATVLEAWFSIMDVTETESNRQHRARLLELLGFNEELDGNKKVSQYETWGSW